MPSKRSSQRVRVWRGLRNAAVIDPEGDLKDTQKRLEEKLARPPWEGVVGMPPSASALSSALMSKDLYVYCGHGDGRKCLPAATVQRLPRCSARSSSSMKSSMSCLYLFGASSNT